MAVGNSAILCKDVIVLLSSLPPRENSGAALVREREETRVGINGARGRKLPGMVARYTTESEERQEIFGKVRQGAFPITSLSCCLLLKTCSYKVHTQEANSKGDYDAGLMAAVSSPTSGLSSGRSTA